MIRLLCLLFITTSAVFAYADVTSTPPNVYKCHYTTRTITIDGLMNEIPWEDAPEITMHKPVTHVPPEENAKGKLLWDEENLYVFIVAPDSDLKGIVTEDDEIVFQEDCLEIFVRPSEESVPYYNFEISVAGGVFDARNEESFGKPTGWSCEGLEKFILLYGTINQSDDVDKGWTLEARIPLACFPTYTGPPSAGDKWPFHLSRYNYAARFGEEGKELSSTAYLTKVNFHQPEEWNELLFVLP